MAAAPARADVIDVNSSADILSTECLVSLCSQSLSLLEYDTNTSGGSPLELGTFGDPIDTKINVTSPISADIQSLEWDLKVFGANTHSVPEPGTMLLMGLGVAAVGIFQRRRVRPVR
jgi:hypothetical protein